MWLHRGINDNRTRALRGKPFLGSWVKDMQIFGNPG